ncbi:hypothetical protein V6Z12_A13G200600 [Gossypium hirsutum]
MMATGQVLKPGDHIYSKCFGGLYDHHGIYVGKAKVKNPRTGKEEQIENAVIHFLGLDKNGKAKTYRPQCPKCFHESHELGVVLTCLDCFYDVGVALLLPLLNLTWLLREHIVSSIKTTSENTASFLTTASTLQPSVKPGPPYAIRSCSGQECPVPSLIMLQEALQKVYSGVKTFILHLNDGDSTIVIFSPISIL